MQILNVAAALQAQILCKLLPGMDVVLDGLEGHVFHEPIALAAINFDNRVVISVEEAKHLRLVCFTEPEAVGDDGAVALKVVLRSSQSSGVHFLVGDSQEENVGGIQAVLRQHLGLNSCLREIFEDPTVLEAVSGLGALAEQ